MASNEVCLGDIVRRLDSVITETKVRNGDTGSLLGVILEVCLNELVGVVTDDLDGVLVSTNCTCLLYTSDAADDGTLV